MYYLQSRYYDATICRFINADGYVSTGQGVIGNNMFAYCNNNPVMGYDPTGEYCVANKDGTDTNYLDDWLIEGAGAGGYGGTGNYFGYGTSYYSYSIRNYSSATNNLRYYNVVGAVSVNDGMATSNSGYLNFKTNQDLESHFSKHGKEFENLYSNSQEYLQGANYVVNNGTYVPEMNGYLKFYGANGHANYAFVGLTQNGAYITTFSIRSVGSLSLVPWLE